MLGQSLRVQVREAREAVEGFALSNQRLAEKARAVTGVTEATKATQVCEGFVCVTFNCTWW